MDILNLLNNLDGNGIILTDEADAYEYFENEYGDQTTIQDAEVLLDILKELDGTGIIITDWDTYNEFAEGYLEFPFELTLD